MSGMAEWHPALEEYCETIFELDEDDIRVVQARIAERLRVSRPSVSEMIKRLDAEGYVKVDDHVIRLTEEGQQLAERVVRRHRLAERFMTDMLGLSWAIAHREAGKWEHVISDEVEEAMLAALGDPTTCPHGNPIPGTDYVEPDLVALSSVPPGEEFRVERIPEALEFEPGILEFLEQNHLLPGAVGEVVGVGPDGTMTVAIGGRSVGVGSFTCERMLVTTA
jgi:DtxR family Mn-dependent transcriptional regulator